MKTIIKFFKKNWLFVGALLSVILDVKYEILEQLINDPQIVTTVRGIGVFVYGYFWTSPMNKKQALKEFKTPSQESDIILPRTK